MKKKSVGGFFRNLLSGKNKAGEVLFAVVDVMPFPNVLNVVRAALKSNPEATTGEVVKDTLYKTDWLRLSVGVLLSYLYFTGKLTAENIEFFTTHLLQFFS
jgi:hypothetical protein